jgi:hypothetical protein
MRNTYQIIFKCFNPFITLHFSILANHYSHIVLRVFDGLQPLDTNYGHKNWIAKLGSSLKQAESEATMINGKVAMMKLTQQRQNCAEIISWKPCIAMLVQSNNVANIGSNETALQVITEASCHKSLKIIAKLDTEKCSTSSN